MKKVHKYTALTPLAGLDPVPQAVINVQDLVPLEEIEPGDNEQDGEAATDEVYDRKQ